MKGCRSITLDEQDASCAWFDQHSHQRMAARTDALILLCISTGFRAAEACSLRVGDVDGRYISLRRCNAKGKHEGRKRVLNAEAREALERWLAVTGDTGQATAWLFPAFTRGRAFLLNKRQHVSPEGLRRQIVRAKQALGWTGQVATHSLRKTSAQRVDLLTGHDVRAVQHHLGHKSLATTQLYLAPDEAALEYAVEHISDRAALAQHTARPHAALSTWAAARRQRRAPERILESTAL